MSGRTSTVGVFERGSLPIYGVFQPATPLSPPLPASPSPSRGVAHRAPGKETPRSRCSTAVVEERAIHQVQIAAVFDVSVQSVEEEDGAREDVAPDDVAEHEEQGEKEEDVLEPQSHRRWVIVGSDVHSGIHIVTKNRDDGEICENCGVHVVEQVVLLAVRLTHRDEEDEDDAHYCLNQTVLGPGLRQRVREVDDEAKDEVEPGKKSHPRFETPLEGVEEDLDFRRRVVTLQPPHFAETHLKPVERVVEE